MVLISPPVHWNMPVGKLNVVAPPSSSVPPFEQHRPGPRAGVCPGVRHGRGLPARKVQRSARRDVERPARARAARRLQCQRPRLNADLCRHC